jgi:serine/threonine protein kinase
VRGRTGSPCPSPLVAHVLSAPLQGSRVLLADYGLFYVTANGSQVDFVVGEPHCMAPEALALGPRSPVGPKADVWSLGMSLVAMACGQLPWASVTEPNVIIDAVLSVAGFGKEPDSVEGFVEGRSPHSPPGLAAAWANLPQDLQAIIKLCLQPDPLKRPSAAQLLDHQFFVALQAKEGQAKWVQKPVLRCLLQDEKLDPDHFTSDGSCRPSASPPRLNCYARGRASVPRAQRTCPQARGNLSSVEGARRRPR